MATYAENLVTARDATLARLNEVLTEKKPSYSVDGQSVSWTEYAESLQRMLERYSVLIQQAEGPYEFTQRAFG